MAEVLNVKKRELTGKLNNRRLRNAGKIPAVLYGKGKESVSLEVCAEEFAAVVRHKAKNVELSGDASGAAVMRDIKWDTFGLEVQHIDFYQ
ncbi:hypothetical protein [Blastopirellula marina]|uniref:50S ribosomal protein L25 n=1 Tax=Blastopirellula marina TaxID=124 RepID=A0A2S8FTF4_9BACT|nr:hypothetical protein [Blastopirellula marina]PQO35461.1 hypothetical protein C5Y98_13955 [Blastopirellula marina]PQO41367.1 hypothetical protein C5Y93_30080 [Blastopirellula marina]PTL44101.1 hypothetical protein C5Y97_13965 [Blastopirellula marina]